MSSFVSAPLRLGARTPMVSADTPTPETTTSTASAPDTGPEPVHTAAFLCALGYLVVDYGRPQDWIPAIGVVRPGLLALSAGLLALLVHGQLPKGRLPRLMLAFLGLMIFTVPLAVNRNRAFWTSWSLLLTFLGGLLPLIALVDTFERLKRLVRLWVVLHVSMALYGLTHAGQGNGSFLIDENDLALALNAALPYTFFLAVLERRVVFRLLAFVSALLVLFGVIATMSRGGFIGLASVSFVIWAKSGRKLVALAAAAVIAGVVYVGAPASYWDEVTSIQSADEEGDTGFQRLYSWRIGWRMFLANPVLGVGANNYPHRAAEYEDETSDRIGYHMWGREAHSLPVTLIAELGLVGTAIYVAMLAHGIKARRMLRRLAQTVRQRADVSEADREKARWIQLTASCLDASLVGIMASAVFLSALYYPHVWVLTAFTAVLLNVGQPVLATAGPRAPQLSPATGRFASGVKGLRGAVVLPGGSITALRQP